MEDMHIHLKDAIYNQELFEKYVKKCIDCGLSKVVFLDHGNRISVKHMPVLSTQEAINEFNKKILEHCPIFFMLISNNLFNIKLILFF